MPEVPPVRVMIGSAGRRVYLLHWFERALRHLGAQGEVHVTEADDDAAAYVAATHRHIVPRYSDPEYAPAMMRIIEKVQPSLFFSVNDFELGVLAATGLAERIRETGTVVFSLAAQRHAAVHDKLAMFHELTRVGIPTVDTALLSDRVGVERLASVAHGLILKDRYGSGSSGFQKVAIEDLGVAKQWLTRGGNSSDSIVVQPMLNGDEFGIDIVAPLRVGEGSLAVLARRKIRMRSGETDQAITIDPQRFVPIASTIAAWTRHQGSIDVDLMEDAVGDLHVIDINPRFGGGYPFSHMAGADVPSAFVAQLSGQDAKHSAAFLTAASGVRSSKHEAIIPAASFRNPE